MSMKRTDRLIGPARGGIAQANRAILNRPNTKHRPDVEDYLDEVFRLAPLVGMDPSIIVAQAVHETGWFTSPRWAQHRNPAGLGIAADDDPDPATFTGTEAARIHVWALRWACRRGFKIEHFRFQLPAKAQPFVARWIKKFADHACPTVVTIDDLNTRYTDRHGASHATWAWDDRYTEKLIATGNRIFPRLPDQGGSSMTIPTTFSVRQPPIFDLATDYARFGLQKWQATEIIGSRFPNRNGGKPRFIVLHIQDGTTRGSLSHWSGDTIDASSTVMVQKDGSILRIIPEQHGPWTNGDIKAPTAEAREILTLGGNPNNWSLTIEAEGRPADTMPQAQHDAIVWQVEDWLMRYPAILDAIWSILRHRFINSQSRWRCPDEGDNERGPYFAPVVAAINAWLEGAVTPPKPEPTPEEPPSIYPPGMSPELARELYEAGGKFTAPWTSKTIGFDEHRSECQYWLARGKLRLKEGERYDKTQWPHLVKITRRGRAKNVHVYQWSNGDVYEKVIRKDQ